MYHYRSPKINTAVLFTVAAISILSSVLLYVPDEWLKDVKSYVNNVTVRSFEKFKLK